MGNYCFKVAIINTGLPAPINLLPLIAQQYKQIGAQHHIIYNV